MDVSLYSSGTHHFCVDFLAEAHLFKKSAARFNP